MQHLLGTFVDITLLKKGPEDVPSSTSVLLVAIALLICAFASSAVVTTGAGGANIAASFFVAVFSYGVYWLVLLLTGFSHRLVPTIASIMACGSILTLLNALAIVILSPLLDVTTVEAIAWLISIWAIPVKGNIIARAIEQNWFVGIAIAMSIFMLQFVVYFYIVSPPAG